MPLCDETLPVEDLTAEPQPQEEIPVAVDAAEEAALLAEEAEVETTAAEYLPTAEEETATVNRLADEFLALAEEMEGIVTPDDLPQEVWDIAADGVPLRDAYLRMWYAEQIRCQKVARADRQASNGSAGSLRDIPADPRPAEAAFARSFHTAVE